MAITNKYMPGDGTNEILRKVLNVLNAGGLGGGGGTTGGALEVTLQAVLAACAAVAVDTNAIAGDTAALAASGDRVGGFSQSIVDNTLIDTDAYSNLDIVGGLRTVPLLRAADGRGAVLQSVTVTDRAHQSAELTFVFFNADPTSSTVADDGAFVLDPADTAKVIGTMRVETGDYYVTAVSSHATKTGIGLVLSAATQDIYYIVICAGTPNYGFDNDLSITLGVLQD
jgi:hypothetical protein